MSRIIWDATLDTALRDMRALGHSWWEIGDVLGVSHGAARRRGIALGFATTRISFGRTTGAEMTKRRAANV